MKKFFHVLKSSNDIPPPLGNKTYQFGSHCCDKYPGTIYSIQVTATYLDTTEWPLLLTWINFNPSMDK